MEFDQIAIAAILLPVIVGITSGLWKQTVVLVMYMTVVVGAIRKWVLPGWSDLALFSGHLLLLGVYFRYFFTRRHTVPLTPFIHNLIRIVVFYDLVSIFNFRSADVRLACVGFALHVYFIPLAFIVGNLFHKKRDIAFFFKWFALFSFLPIILGIYQYFLPTGHWLNQYVDDVVGVAVAGGHTRISSTFSFITGYGTYLRFVMAAVLPLLAIKNSITHGTRIYMYSLIPLILISLLMTGSRGPTGTAIASVVIFLLVASHYGMTGKKIAARFIIILGIGAVLFLQSQGAKEAYESFHQRAETSNQDLIPRIIDTLTPFKFADEAGILGYGIGNTYTRGLNALGMHLRQDTGSMPIDFEEEPERIVIELGVLGFILTYGLRWILVFFSWQTYKTLKDLDLKFLALSSLLFQIPFLFIEALVFSMTASVFYWFMIGVTMALLNIEKKQGLLLQKSSAG